MKLLRGIVESVVNGGIYVIVPDYDEVDAFGPLQTVYTGDIPAYAPNDRVLVGQVGKIKEDLIVLGKVGNP